MCLCVCVCAISGLVSEACTASTTGPAASCRHMTSQCCSRRVCCAGEGQSTVVLCTPVHCCWAGTDLLRPQQHYGVLYHHHQEARAGRGYVSCDCWLAVWLTPLLQSAMESSRQLDAEVRGREQCLWPQQRALSPQGCSPAPGLAWPVCAGVCVQACAAWRREEGAAGAAVLS